LRALLKSDLFAAIFNGPRDPLAHEAMLGARDLVFREIFSDEYHFVCQTTFDLLYDASAPAGKAESFGREKSG
jgi:hypothetical protein